MMFLRYLRLALPFLLISLASFPVDAAVQQDTPYSNLSTPAPQVANPSGAELIAITRAGDRLVAGGAHGIIVYSDDNGVTWHQASVPGNADHHRYRICHAKDRLGGGRFWRGSAYHGWRRKLDPAADRR